MPTMLTDMEDMILKSHVFRGKNGKLFMQICPKCEKENYALSVASGQCAWCGYEATENDIDDCELQE